MEYEAWEQNVPDALKAEAIWQLEVYRLTLFVNDLGWGDVTRLRQDGRLGAVADFLHHALAALRDHLVAGHGRHPERARMRFYDHALEAAREARGWYVQAALVLEEETTQARLTLLTAIIRLLLDLLPHERHRTLRDGNDAYVDNLPQTHAPRTASNPEP